MQNWRKLGRMKLIRKLGTRTSKNGKLESWAEFLCPNIVCNKIVERLLSNGKRQKHCGCIPKNYKHGGKGAKLYTVWGNMKDRCLNLNNHAYKDYGGRGITICPEWTNDYVKFRDWAISNSYKEGLQINRIENNGNYEPNNCNFVTSQINNQNQRSTKVTLEIANKIRDSYNTGDYTFKKLSKLFKLSEGHIKNIIYNKRWKTND